MRLLLFFIMLLPFCVVAQVDSSAVVAVDSLWGQKTQQLVTLQLQKDSLEVKLEQRLDSLQGELKQVQLRLDSLQRTAVAGAEVLQDSLVQVLRKGQALEQRLLEKQHMLTASLTKATALEKLNISLPELSKAGVPNLPKDILPDLNAKGIPGVELPKAVLPDVSLQLLSLPDSPKHKEALPEDISELPDLSSQLSKDKLSMKQLEKTGLPSNLPAVIDSSSVNADNIEKKLEEQIRQRKEVAALQEQTALGEDPLKEYLQQDAKALASEQAAGLPLAGAGVTKEDLSGKQLQRKAVDHFAGKQEALNQARKNLNKYKGRFSEIKSIKELPKSPLKRHPLMGVKWYKRVQPGLQWQIGTGDAFRVDIGPRVSYLLTDKIEFGASVQGRLSMGSKVPSWISFNYGRVWGYNVFGSYEVKKGFYGQLSYERLNTEKVKLPGQKEEPLERLWVEGLRVGIGKRYTLYRQLRGYSLMEYNFSPSLHTPYRQQLQVKVGVMWDRRGVR